ncbi:MAG: HEAT repeat domain-containing protein, partial [Opitutales bacterium]
GAYVCSTTEFLFLVDADGDDKSESRRVIYSGFGNADVHHMIHGLRWAPWGDLYFTQSIYVNTFVETAYGPRRMNGSGIWRFRPDGERLEAYAVGMVNPWGLAFDHWGQSFGTDGAGGSGPHYVFPGGAYPTAVGAHRVLRGLIPGKPKNTAAEFVSGDHMPENWRGSLLANDFRANRTVRYELKEKGSGYTAREVETVLRSSHRSFRPVDIKMGPDGAVYVVDWYNPIIDHGEVDFHHPSRDKAHGRIWRLVAKDRPLLKRETIAGAKAAALLDLLKSSAQYNRVQARRELARHDPAKLLPVLKKWLGTLDKKDPDYEHHRLEGLWLVVALRTSYPELAAEVLRSNVPQVRAAAVRAISRWSERAGPIDKLGLLAQAVEDPHPRVRLEAVSALREIGTLEAANVALRALGQEVDNNLAFSLELTVRHLRDKWLPAMQAGKPVFDGDPSRLAYALKEVGDPRAIAPLVEVIKAGGITAADLPQAVTTVSALGQSPELDAMLAMAKKTPALLPAIAAGAATNSRAPSQSQAVTDFLASKKSQTRVAAAQLCGAWKVSSAREKLIELTSSKSLNLPEASSYCQALAAIGATSDLQELSTPGHSARLRAAAIAAWAKGDPGKAADGAATLLTSLGEPEAADSEAVFSAFIGRREGAEALTKAISKKKLHRAVAVAGVTLAHASGRDLTALISTLNSAGGLQPLAQTLSPKERTQLLAEAQKSGNAERGREIYHRKAMLCATCHLIDN